MATQLLSEVKILVGNSGHLDYLLRVHGFSNYTLRYISETKAVIVFENEEDATIFILKGIEQELRDTRILYTPAADYELMIRLEKKLKTFSPADEYIIRKTLKNK